MHPYLFIFIHAFKGEGYGGDDYELTFPYFHSEIAV